MDDWFDLIPFAFFGTIMLAIIGFVGSVCFDQIQAVRARPAMYACLDRNLEPVRLDWSTRVSCRSRHTGADTLTVNQVAK